MENLTQKKILRSHLKPYFDVIIFFASLKCSNKHA